MAEFDFRTLARFWSKVEKRAPSDCWLWTGGLKRGGYGQFKSGANKVQIAAHKFSWILVNGSVPRDQFVLHSCDIKYPPRDFTSRRCVNPRHLWLGTHQENVSDMVRKKRQPRGESHGMVKLSDTAAKEILDRRHSGEKGIDLAEEFNVSRSTVSAIYTGRRWAHLSPPVTA